MLFESRVFQPAHPKPFLPEQSLEILCTYMYYKLCTQALSFETHMAKMVNFNVVTSAQVQIWSLIFDMKFCDQIFFSVFFFRLTCPLFFVNSACLWIWNICIILRDNKLNQAFLIYFFSTKKLTEVLWNFQSMFNQIQPKFNRWVLGLWPTLPQTFIIIGGILFVATGSQYRSTCEI